MAATAATTAKSAAMAVLIVLKHNIGRETTVAVTAVTAPTASHMTTMLSDQDTRPHHVDATSMRLKRRIAVA